jgi:tetratricopeptide (TPR) repeat protein
VSEAVVVTETPFIPNALDEESELRALVRALGFAEKFSLLFVRCNQPVQRQRLMAAVRKQLPQMTIQEIHLREPISHLLDEIRQQMTEPPPNAIFVTGLEHSLPSLEHAPASPFVANLNVARDLFTRDLPCPLVLWVPEYVLIAITQGAPDFFSIRSGVFSFVVVPSEAVPLTRSLLDGTIGDARNLSAKEKQERIQEIEALLSDFQNLPFSQRDRRTEAQLLDRLGLLFFDLGNFQEAEKKFRDSSELWQAIGDGSSLVNSYHHLGMLAQARGTYGEALTWYRQALAINEKLGNRANMTTSYHHLGMLAQARGAYDEALTWYRQALALDEALGNRAGMANAYFRLGVVAHIRRAYDEARTWYRRALAINEELGNRVGLAASYHNLGLVAQELGAYDEACTWYRQALAINEELGNPMSMAISYGQLAALLTARGEVDEALLLNLQGLTLNAELQSPQVTFSLRLLQHQREQWGEEQFLATLRKYGDEKATQELLRLLPQNHN